MESYLNRIERGILDFFNQLPAGAFSSNSRRRSADDIPDDDIYKRILDAPQNVFTAALMATGKQLFPSKKLLHDEKYRGKDNRYNYDLLLQIADDYIYICAAYDKEPSLYGYAALLNATAQELNALYPRGMAIDNDVTRARIDLRQKIMTARENSLAAALYTGKKNVVGILATLNHYYNWAAPGMPRDDGDDARRLTADNLPRLCISDADNDDGGR